MTATTSLHLISSAAAPLAYVAPRRSSPQRQLEERMAAAAAALGMRTHIGAGADDGGDDDDTLDPRCDAALDGAHVVICHVVGPDDVPVEVALAAVRGIPVLAFVPAAVDLAVRAAQLLAGANAKICRYASVSPETLLDDALLGLQPASASAPTSVALAA